MSDVAFESFRKNYSWTQLIRIRTVLIFHYFELKTISFGFAVHSFTISYFVLSLFSAISHSRNSNTFSCQRRVRNSGDSTVLPVF